MVPRRSVFSLYPGFVVSVFILYGACLASANVYHQDTTGDIFDTTNKENSDFDPNPISDEEAKLLTWAAKHNPDPRMVRFSDRTRKSLQALRKTKDHSKRRFHPWGGKRSSENYEILFPQYLPTKPYLKMFMERLQKPDEEFLQAKRKFSPWGRKK